MFDGDLFFFVSLFTDSIPWDENHNFSPTVLGIFLDFFPSILSKSKSWV